MAPVRSAAMRRSYDHEAAYRRTLRWCVVATMMACCGDMALAQCSVFLTPQTCIHFDVDSAGFPDDPVECGWCENAGVCVAVVDGQGPCVDNMLFFRRYLGEDFVPGLSAIQNNMLLVVAFALVLVYKWFTRDTADALTNPVRWERVLAWTATMVMARVYVDCLSESVE